MTTLSENVLEHDRRNGAELANLLGTSEKKSETIEEIVSDIQGQLRRIQFVTQFQNLNEKVSISPESAKTLLNALGIQTIS